MSSDGKGHWNPSRWYRIGWAGRNGAAANAMLADFLGTDDRRSLDIGLTCLDSWASAVPGADLPPQVSRAAILPYVGAWTVHYNNGAVSVLTFFPNGRGGDTAYWGTGTLRADADGLACDWSRGQKERYRLAGDRSLTVTHVFEGKTYTGSLYALRIGYDAVDALGGVLERTL
jgi:hypothetical protein